MYSVRMDIICAFVVVRKYDFYYKNSVAKIDDKVFCKDHQE